MFIDWGNVNWGDAPTWVSAITTALALAAAASLVRIERRRDRNARDAAERDEQAAYVAAWHSRWSDYGDAICLRNGSQLPIYDAQVALVDMDDPNVNRLVHLCQATPVVPPGDHRVEYPAGFRPRVDELGDQIDAGQNAQQLRILLTFWDSAGRGWSRDPFGHLTRIAEDGKDVERLRRPFPVTE